MRVVLTTNFSPWSAYCGGGQHSTHRLATALAEHGHDVAVVYTKPPWETVQVPPNLAYAAHWAALPSLRSRRAAALRPAAALTVAHRVRQLVRNRDPAVVHGNGEESALVARLRPRHRFGLVVTPRYPAFPTALADGSWRHPARVAAAWLRYPKFAALGLALHAADRWCPTSRASADATAAAYGLSSARCRVVGNGIAPEFFAVTRRADAPRGPLLFFGRIATSKGVLTLADALLELGPRAPPSVFVGRGPALEALQRRLAGLSGVSFVPWLGASALAERVAGASMVVLPSLEESFGNAMAETMAAGAPLVTTTAGSIPELVQPDQTAVMVPPNDASALAQAIARLHARPALGARLGQAGRREMVRRTWSAVAVAHAEIYAEAQAGR